MKPFRPDKLMQSMSKAARDWQLMSYKTLEISDLADKSYIPGYSVSYRVMLFGPSTDGVYSPPAQVIAEYRRCPGTSPQAKRRARDPASGSSAATGAAVQPALSASSSTSTRTRPLANLSPRSFRETWARTSEIVCERFRSVRGVFRVFTWCSRFVQGVLASTRTRPLASLGLAELPRD